MTSGDPTTAPSISSAEQMPVAGAERKRIDGFDLARAYAIFGMFVVNFNVVFGSLADATLLGKCLNLFNGNSSSAFVILAGMGVALMTGRKEYTLEEKRKLKSVVVRRSWFLFAAGLLLYVWWPADILHFYGGYLHIAALLLFVPKRFYLWAAAGGVVIFHALLLVIPYERGWNFETLEYSGFWTPGGFLRNTFYNGWNPIFPWMSFFLLGMWLGRLDWQCRQTRRNILAVGAGVFLLVEALQFAAERGVFGAEAAFYLTADYLPPFLPFMAGTTGFTLMLLPLCIAAGERFAGRGWLRALVRTGQMTLTHYVAHLTIGLILLAVITGRTETLSLNAAAPLPPWCVLLYSVLYFLGSVLFSELWRRRFRNGPLELLMRKLSDGSQNKGMNSTNTRTALLLLLTALCCPLCAAQTSVAWPDGRMASTSDGNVQDPDYISGTLVVSAFRMRSFVIQETKLKRFRTKVGFRQ